MGRAVGAEVALEGEGVRVETVVMVSVARREGGCLVVERVEGWVMVEEEEEEVDQVEVEAEEEHTERQHPHHGHSHA